MILTAESICILLGMLPLVVGYLQSNLPLAAMGAFAVGLLWLLSRRVFRAWIASIGLFIFVCASGVGAWLGLSPILMAISVLGSLSAWDLAGFFRRLGRAAPEDDLIQLGKKHLVQLGIFMGVSMILALLGLLIRVNIPFWWVFLLVLVTVLGIMKLGNRIQRGG